MTRARIETLAVGPLQANCYIVADASRGDAAIIDPGGDAELIAAALERNGLHPTCIINTHAHPDHTAANAALKERFDIPLLIHEADAPLLAQAGVMRALLGMFFPASPPPDRLLRTGDEIRVGDLSLRVLHTPGHTPGSVCLYLGREEPVLFSGDTVFQAGVGRTDLPGGAHDALLNSIKMKIIPLPDNTRILPGHGSETTLQREKRENPFFET
jgi:glyoxylase-like metal-dependent hydrolase (beta-lactamase superfamily II)